MGRHMVSFATLMKPMATCKGGWRWVEWDEWTQEEIARLAQMSVSGRISWLAWESGLHIAQFWTDGRHGAVVNEKPYESVCGSDLSSQRWPSVCA